MSEPLTDARLAASIRSKLTAAENDCIDLMLIESARAANQATAERDAARAQMAALHEALRANVVVYAEGPFLDSMCTNCWTVWPPSESEKHQPDCLAALAAPQPVGGGEPAMSPRDAAIWAALDSQHRSGCGCVFTSEGCPLHDPDRQGGAGRG